MAEIDVPRAELEAVVATLNRVEKSLDEAGELHELAAEEDDASTIDDVITDILADGA